MSEPRPLHPDELLQLGELLNDIFRRGQGVHDQDVLRDFPLAFAARNLSNCRVIVAEGQLISHAAIWPRELIVDGQRLKLGVVTLVATHPNFRHRGHAACLMRHLQEMLRVEQYDLGLLWTGVPDFYRRLGWEVVQPQGWLVRDLGSCRRLAELALSESAAERVESYIPDRHLAGIVALHEREPVRLARSDAEYAALLSIPKMDVRVLVREGTVTAYLVTGRACNKRGLMEYGGAAENIGALAADVCHSPPLVTPLPLVIHHTRPDLARLLQRIGAGLEPLPCSKGPGCEMIFEMRPDRTADIRRQLFIWGLDVT